MDDCLLVVHKSPKAESAYVRSAVEQYMKDEFKDFLINRKNKNNESASKIINSFNLFNKLLEKNNTSYNNFFLFDNPQLLSNYKSSFIKNSLKYVNWDEKQQLMVKKYLNYLTEFYTFLIEKTEVKEREESKQLIFTKPNGIKIKFRTAKKA